MGWVYLVLAVASEVVAMTALRQSEGFHRVVPDIIVVLGVAASFILLAFTLKYMEIGPVYALWAGLGTAALALIGVVIFKEPASLVKVVSITLIVVGIMGLNLAGTSR